MKENGYINATKIRNDAMKITGSKKPFKKWKINSNVNELMEEIYSSAGIPADELLITITGGKITEIRGTYVVRNLLQSSIAIDALTNI